MHNNIQKLIADIEREVHITRNYTGRDKLDSRVMDAIKKVPRDQFIPANLRHLSYQNRPLKIGHRQTISQPYIVALMTDLLAIKPTDRILEIGTGSGYQSAILSQLCAQVYTVERIRELGQLALERFNKLGFSNIHTTIGNGYHGWPEHAPYDGILVTAAATQIPQKLLDQLKPGGRLAIPVGYPAGYQQLLLVSKDKNGDCHTSSIIGVSFVPLVDDEELENNLNS